MALLRSWLSLFRACFLGVCFGLAITRSILWISHSEQLLKEWDRLSDQATNSNLPSTWKDNPINYQKLYPPKDQEDQNNQQLIKHPRPVKPQEPDSSNTNIIFDKYTTTVSKFRNDFLEKDSKLENGDYKKATNFSDTINNNYKNSKTSVDDLETNSLLGNGDASKKGTVSSITTNSLNENTIKVSNFSVNALETTSTLRKGDSDHLSRINHTLSQNTNYDKEETPSMLSGSLEFQKQPRVAIVTKIHGPHQLGLLEQSMCLLHQAYNKRVLYDIVVFSTLPVNETLLVNLKQNIVAPAKLELVVDNPGLQELVRNLNPVRREKFLSRCNVSSEEEVTWKSSCYEPFIGQNGNLRYNWQAEFRSWHIWNHPCLKEYSYMMWLDTDSFCSKVWKRDPIAIAIQNKLAILFGNFPMGSGKGVDLQERIQKVFNTTLCTVKLQKNGGHLEPTLGGKCPKATVPDVHGFFHITNLDFYRSPIVQSWCQALIGDCFLCRRFDDQVAVTVPAAILAPTKSWDMYSHNIKLNVVHNYVIDGKRKNHTGGFKGYWQKNGATYFPEAYAKCKITEGG